ncbi:MAG TPA: PKD domain-containing protein [Baekduia sp.]|uniref:PKD domain-containing protein n=1 Tax=Baekduia sp. TaxID=2600305 RepID=UPI002D776DF6|nr:PKD domain-containing protein [Baekduia sp.]HET6507703.1 PKD domain-containing protein [Baekduia sp.]
MRRRRALLVAAATTTLTLSSAATASADWLGPDYLSAASHTASRPQLSLAADNSATAVYTDADDGVVAERKAEDASAFTAPEQLSTPGATVGGLVSATASDGRAIAAWTEGGSRLLVAMRDVDGDWTTTPVTAPDAGATSPAVALGAHGHAYVTWAEGSTLYGAYWDSDSWGAPTALSTGSGDPIATTSAIATDTGITWVVWADAHHTHAGFYTGYGLINEAVLGDASGATRIQLAADAGGGVTALWSAPSLGEQTAFAGGFAGFGPTQTLKSGSGSGYHPPALSVASDGTALAVWGEDGPAGDRSYAATRDDAGTWATPVPIVGGVAQGAAVARPGGESAALTTDDAGDLYVTRHTAGGWTGQERIAGHAADVTAVGAADGTLLVGWTTDDRAAWALDDRTLPAVGDVSVPILLTAGVEATFGATATDTWSGVDRLVWDFGDHTGPVVGDAPTHVYAHAGEFTVTVTAYDRAGNERSETRDVTVVAAPAGGGAGDSGGNAGGDGGSDGGAGQDDGPTTTTPATTTTTPAPGTGTPAPAPGAPALAPLGRARLLHAHTLRLRTLLARRAIRTVYTAPADGTVTITATLGGKRLAATKALAVRGGTATKVSVKLSAATRAKLARRRSAKVTLKATYRAADGRTVTTTSTMVAR